MDRADDFGPASGDVPEGAVVQSDEETSILSTLLGCEPELGERGDDLFHDSGCVGSREGLGLVGHVASPGASRLFGGGCGVFEMGLHVASEYFGEEAIPLGTGGSGVAGSGLE